KYGESVDEVLAWSQQAAARLDDLVTADDRVELLAAELEQIREELTEAAVSLSVARRDAAGDFAAQVSDELAHLAMGKARLEVQVVHRADPNGLSLPDGERVRLARHGIDDVEILLAAGPGATPRSVAKAASGGELSRVMLALEVVGAGRGGPPTFVFDEVDAGVGGRAALDVGARLAALAQQSQVIVVTHLAQVAAFADRHLVVHKADDGAITSSSIRVLEGDEQLRELSRMMGGDPDSEAGLAHARDLRDRGRRSRGARRGVGGRSAATR
ncbi:MAG: DNA repair protein RecN, partial [Dermatophilaceae bacterium]